ncbi:PP2C family protein-serine/threonine phosphatase [Streptomyces sp. NPDC023838]|uniref:PP2C family protein-serine/threonine phosphatase n=1 Tax=Streptomyces sp. NPDC023838 TaxID=3154325 RepID=UPI0034102C6F
MDLRALSARRLPYHRLRHALLAAPFALIALVTVGDVVAPRDVHLGPFLVAAPALTASFAGPRTTGFVGAVAVLAQIVVAMVRGSATDLNHSFQIISLILISVFVTLFAHLREVREKELVQLRSVAEAAQQVVLRPLRERIGPLRVASVYLAAAAEAQIGGDLYAAARTAHGTRLLIGDVRGKGLEAVGDAAVLLGAFRASAHQEAELSGLVAYLEGAVAPDLDDVSAGDGVSAGEADDVEDRGEAFITAAVLDVPDDRQTVRLVNCGHPPPLLLRGGRVVPLDVARPAPPLGLSELVGPGYAAKPFGAGSSTADTFAAETFASDTFAFETGDIMLLYTDGVIEARDGTGTFYPLAERLAAWSGTGPRALLRHLCDDLLAHAAGHCLGDDAAMVAIERLG